MALKLPPPSLVIALVQGAADGFIQGSVLTGLQGDNNIYRLVGVELENQSASWSAVDNARIDITVTRRSKASVPLISDPDVLFKFGTVQEVQGAAFMNVLPSVQRYILPSELEVPIVEDTIFAQLDSTATAIVQSWVVKLLLARETMSQVDRLEVIARSIQ